jgi:hypothetical protein
MDERYFDGIRNRIADLEKEPVKDATTVRRLAEQYNLLGKYYVKNNIWDMPLMPTGIPSGTDPIRRTYTIRWDFPTETGEPKRNPPRT